MLRFPDFQRKDQRNSFLAASSLVLLLTTQLFAQSGRRTAKLPQTPTTPPQTNTENTEATPKQGARELTRKVTLLVARQLTSTHRISEDAIFATFVKRLGEFTNVTAASLGDLKRDNAIKRAKSETEAIVVLVQFDIDSFQHGTIILNSPDLDVRVLVFAPVTGHEKFKGKVYYKAVGGPMLKKDNWPNGTPIRITTEGVGIEAAEQVRDWLVVEELRNTN